MNNPQIVVGKRFLFVLPQLELGGAERQALHFARHLKGLGCDVRVWGHANPGLVVDQCKEAGIPWAFYYFRWPCRKRSLMRVSLGLLRFFRALRRERPDVILAYSSWPNISCGLTWHWSTAKVFIWGQRDRVLGGDSIQRFAYRRATAVICNASHEVDFLRRTLGESSAPVYIVNNGVDLEPCMKTRTEWRAEFEIDEDATVVAMLANFRFQKDHPTLLHAWHKLLATIPEKEPRPRLLLAGAPQESFKTVHQLTNSLELFDTVSFLGQVDDISGLLTASDIGILTSPQEGLPNAIIEYMASGLPVIATDTPGNREALGDDPEQPFCMQGDPESLASRLQVLLNDQNLRQRLGIRNRQRALEKFSVDAMCRKTVGIIADQLDAVVEQI